MTLTGPWGPVGGAELGGAGPGISSESRGKGPEEGRGSRFGVFLLREAGGLTLVATNVHPLLIIGLIAGLVVGRSDETGLDTAVGPGAGLDGHVVFGDLIVDDLA